MHTLDLIAPATVRLTSVGVSVYSLALSTETILVSSSLDIRTSQFRAAVTCGNIDEIGYFIYTEGGGH